MGPRARGLGAATVVALVAFLPFLRGVLAGHCFFFRDLSGHFFPLRRFAVDGLLHGQLRYWNPFLHEGVPCPFPPISYPLDLLQLLLPDERGFSLLLALHVPLAALAFMVLARHLGTTPLAAAGGAIAYALGGFCLSTLNLYVYVEAMAWAPLVVWGLLRVAEGAPAAVPVAAATIALCVSTAGAEIVIQAVLIGVALGLRLRPPRRWAGTVAAVVLGAGLAGPTVLVLGGLAAATERGSGFPVDVALGQSIHPLTFLQVVVGGLYGDLSRIPGVWWGSNFFPRGFPYILSLYLGLLVLALAAVGALGGHALRRRLALLALLAGVVCLGRWAHLGPLVEALPLLRAFRMPTKVFFTVHLVAALLAALGLDALERGLARSAWRILAVAALGSGGLLSLAPALPAVLPGPTRWFAAGFFPPGYSWPLRLHRLEFVLHDAAAGGLVAIAGGLLALVVLRRRLAPRHACLGLVALVACDLLRTGAGLNAMVTRAFYAPSAEMSRIASGLPANQRLFTCDPELSRAYWQGREARGDEHEMWTFLVFMETLIPNYDMRLGVPTAYSKDLTSLVPTWALPPLDATCDSFGAIADRLREASVARVLSLDPLDDPSLELREALAPPRIAPVVVHVYDLSTPLPLAAVAGSVRSAASAGAAAALARTPGLEENGGVAVEGFGAEVDGASGRVLSADIGAGRAEVVVEADRATAVIVRQNWARGWTARVNGAAAPVLRANGRHQAVPVGAGQSRVVLRYRPPQLVPGVVLMVVSAVAVVACFLRSRPRAVVS